MSAIARNWKWIVATLLVAAIVHVASVFAVPRLIMWRTMTGMAHRAGGVNRILHTTRPTAAARGVVRPSPDLFYSTCVFDLKDGPVLVHAMGMPDTYWSVSLFDEETNNFYVYNDRQTHRGGFDILIVPPDWDVEKPIPYRVAHAPGRRGLVLIRTLISDDTKLPSIDAARRHATCTPFKARTPQLSWPGP